MFYAVCRFFHDFRWAIKHRLVKKHQYHIVRPRSLRPGYHDPDEVILHACMELLSQNYEALKRQNPNEEWPDEEHGNWGAARREIKAIYDWWTKDRPLREPLRDHQYPLPEVPGNHLDVLFGSEHENDPSVIEWHRIAAIHNRLDDEWDAEDDAMLHRLINIRLYLWD